ncbi:hypothetical protein, conserved [Trypanosoma cruzi]|uniref:Uncharacterized protein n=1 Tax=Trypanosoma cruzi (strain CL Brener) TaxID=353153 RepID=Q4E2L1_TRYCC|nr:hypothetical protein, conserved [Trypanosoma cruzi]EAN99000.1 hypothetical protein, conserved [Trypanosoma cruzi]|eukprot:XP_820851.1 hypothetical protein [Trypanosoma cruzi strain CL Brener]
MPIRKRGSARDEGMRGLSVAAGETSPSSIGRNRLASRISEVAWEKTRRHGGFASVVDPLLSLLMRLRRVQLSVVYALEALGVEGNQLGPYGCASVDREGAGTPDNTVRDDDLFLGAPNPLECYIMAHKHRKPCFVNIGEGLDNFTRETQEKCIDAILRWVDDRSPCDAISDVDFSRSKLVASLTALADDSHVTTNNHTSNTTEEGNVAAAPPLHKKRRGSSQTLDGSNVHFGRHWKHYATQLREAHRSERAVVKRFCATGIGKGLSLCSKRGKIERGHAVCVTTPGAVCLQGNYNDLTRAKDALAGCQRNITGLLSELESTIDEYADQSQKVAECEETFWSNVKLAELESKALLHLSRRIRFVAGSH